MVLMNWKDFLYYSRTESLAVLFILIVILLTLNLNVLLSKRNSSHLTIAENDSLIAAFERLHDEMKDKRVAAEQIDFSEKKNTNNNSHNQREVNQTYITDHKENNRQLRYPTQEKLKDSEFIYLNETDTTQWKKIPGIGSSYAKRIVKYRSLLGGFTSIHQLKEVYGIDDEMFDKITSFIREDVDCESSCEKLRINQLEFKQIIAHPYIDFEQTKAIVNLRRRIGNISSMDELAMLEEFSAEDIKRLSPYLQF